MLSPKILPRPKNPQSLLILPNGETDKSSAPQVYNFRLLGVLMARRTLLTWLILSCCLTSVHAETAAEGKEKNESAQKPTPVVQRRASLPEGWFHTKTRTKVGKTLAKTLGEDGGQSKTQQAVHLNATGISRSYRSRGKQRSGAANRLRAIRDAVILPDATVKSVRKPEGIPSDTNSKLLKIQTPSVLSDSTKAPSSRRRRPDRTSDPSPMMIANPNVQQGQTDQDGHLQGTGAEDIPAATRSLPSVMKRSGTPTLAAQPVDEPTPAEPTLADRSTGSAPPAKVASRAVPRPLLTMEDSDPVEPLADQPAAVLGIETPVEPMPFKELPAESVSPNAVQEKINPSDTEQTGPPVFKSRTEPIPPQEKIQRMQLGSEVDVSKPEPTDPVFSDQPAGVSDSTQADGQGDLLVSNRSPVLVVETHGPRKMRVGRTATYYVTAANAGNLGAEDVAVNVNIPSWTEVTRNQASAGLVRLQPNQEGHSVLRWTISKLEAKSRQRLRLELVPRSSRPVDLGVTWNFKPVSALTQIEVQEPKLQMSVVGPQDIQFGETKLYTISVSNPGSGDAENVVLTLLPISDGGGTAGVREMGVIEAGTRRTVEVELTARQAGQLAVRATASADGGLQTQAEQRVRVRRANLEVEVAGPSEKYAGTTARYAIKVSNTGDATARDVVAVAALPMAAKYLQSSGGGAYDVSRGKVRWSIGTLRPGAFQIVELSSLLMGSGKNRLDVRSSGADQLASAGSVTTEVKALADLKLMVNDPRGAVAVGSEMVYEVRIINRGTKEARNVSVVGYFSEGIEPIAVRGWRGDVEIGQVVLEQIPRIAPGQEMVVKVAAQASRPGDHVFRTELESSDPETKLAVEEWTRFYGDEIASKPTAVPERDMTVPRSLPPERLE